MVHVAATFARVVVDVGAGDGAYVLHRARSEPGTFVIAIDACPDALVDGAWKAKRLRLGNVAFLIESVERLPSSLDGIADEITVHFPWGSLLAGLIVADPAILARLATLLKPGGELRMLISATARDCYAETGAALLRSERDRYASAGLALIESREARPDDIAASRSSWAKRLGAGRSRPVVFARYRRLGS